MNRALFPALALLAALSSGCTNSPLPASAGSPLPESVSKPPASPGSSPIQAQSILPFEEKAIAWLVKAQHPNGGWGAGSHANQGLRDPQQVMTDPATTAFTALALIRAGHTPSSGEHREAARRATEHLVGIVEESPADGPRITDITGTQPQAKLGPLVDTSMTVHFLSRVLPTIEKGSRLRERVDQALEKCLRKLEASQESNGSWKAGGWAPVLQSSLSCSALELAKAAGKQVDPGKLDRARSYQKSNFDLKTGRAATADAAGVELYAYAGSQRAAAGEAWAALDLVKAAKSEGKLPSEAPVSKESLRRLGLDGEKAARLSRAYEQSEAQVARLGDQQMLAGFGNNGGEEYLSYLLTSESLVMSGGEHWEKWDRSIHERLEKVQSPDGSWTGHHCITSPVFCTAAALQCLTTDRDADLLRRIGSEDVASAIPVPAPGR